MNDLIKKVGISIGVGVLALLTIVFTSEFIFGDLTKTDSYKPLWVVVPAFAIIFTYLFIKTEK
jgi:hypothetical protein